MKSSGSSNDHNDSDNNTSNTPLGDESTGVRRRRLERLPTEIRAMIVSAMIRPRLLDLRIRTHLSPSAVAHLSQSMRSGYIVGTRTIPPKPMVPPFMDPLTGYLRPVESLRWFGQRDLLLVDVSVYLGRTFRVQQPELVQNVGLIMNGRLTMPWGNILNTLPFVRRVFVIRAMNDHLWTLRDIDNSSLYEAEFEEQFVGVAEGIPGMARVGRILHRSNDIVEQMDFSMYGSRADLRQWLARNWAPTPPRPAPVVECRLLFGDIEERIRNRHRQTHPRYVEDADFEV